MKLHCDINVVIESIMDLGPWQRGEHAYILRRVKQDYDSGMSMFHGIFKVPSF